MESHKKSQNSAFEIPQIPYVIISGKKSDDVTKSDKELLDEFNNTFNEVNAFYKNKKSSKLDEMELFHLFKMLNRLIEELNFAISITTDNNLRTHFDRKLTALKANRIEIWEYLYPSREFEMPLKQKEKEEKITPNSEDIKTNLKILLEFLKSKPEPLPIKAKLSPTPEVRFIPVVKATVVEDPQFNAWKIVIEELKSKLEAEIEEGKTKSWFWNSTNLKRAKLVVLGKLL